MTQLAVSIPEAAAALSIGKTKMRELIADGRVPTIRFDRAIRVPVAALERLVEQEQSYTEDVWSAPRS